MVIIIFGLPGSGKTFFAGHLAEAYQAVHISSDKVRNDLGKQGQYDGNTKTKIYQRMDELMKLAVKQNKNVVLDATFYQSKHREMIKKLVNDLGQTAYFIEIMASESTIKKRLNKKREYSEADFKVYQKVKQQFEPMKEEHLTIKSDTSRIEDMLSIVKKYIRSNEPGAN